MTDEVTKPSDDEVTKYPILDSWVATVKAMLLRKPITAYESARRLSNLDGNQTIGHEVYRRVAEELAIEGYAPDANGQPGPAVKSHYSNHTLGNG